MARHKKMSPAAQAAAVRQMLSEGTKLDQIEADYANLSDGIGVVRAEQSKPARRGSGSAPSKPPTYQNDL